MIRFRGGSRGSEKLSDLPKVTQPEESESHARQADCVTGCLSWSRDSHIISSFHALSKLVLS